jgi:hypothetical protein
MGRIPRIFANGRKGRVGRATPKLEARCALPWPIIPRIRFRGVCPRRIPKDLPTTSAGRTRIEPDPTTLLGARSSREAAANIPSSGPPAREGCDYPTEAVGETGRRFATREGFREVAGLIELGNRRWRTQKINTRLTYVTSTLKRAGKRLSPAAFTGLRYNERHMIGQ